MFALVSVAGKDRPGIVRDVAAALLPLGASIEDSAMTALRGHFTIMMLVRLPEGVPFPELAAVLADLERATGLWVRAHPVDEAEAQKQPPAPNALVHVMGADRPGIVHAIAAAIAEAGGNIVDVATRAEGGRYRMALEVVAPSLPRLKAALAEAARKAGVQAEARPIADDAGAL